MLSRHTVVLRSPGVLPARSISPNIRPVDGLLTGLTLYLRLSLKSDSHSRLSFIIVLMTDHTNAFCESVWGWSVASFHFCLWILEEKRSGLNGYDDSYLSLWFLIVLLLLSGFFFLTAACTMTHPPTVAKEKRQKAWHAGNTEKVQRKRLVLN